MYRRARRLLTNSSTDQCRLKTDQPQYPQQLCARDINRTFCDAPYGGYGRCAYHGWRFDSDGKCLKIPQSEKGGKDEAHAAACPKVYPTQVR